MLAARARPGDGRDSNEESNAANAKDGCRLQGISGRVGDPQATTGAPTEWDDEKAAYVADHGATHHAAHEATHHAAHGRGDRQGLPALRRCLVLPRRKISRGKPDSAEALPIFCRPKNASTKKRLLSLMTSVGGPIPILKGCRRCLVLPRRKIFRIASDDEFVSKERGHEPDDNKAAGAAAFRMRQMAASARGGPAASARCSADGVFVRAVSGNDNAVAASAR
jgi:hypothetical protein